MVCGQPDFDVDAVMANATFEKISPTDVRVGYLRDILKAFSPKERSQFARFVSGRERLPPSLHLKIMHSTASDGAPPDSHLPTASTCFYWLSLPHFSSREAMAERLRFAITQCLDIDADFVMRGGGDGGGGGGGGHQPPRGGAPQGGGGANGDMAALLARLGISEPPMGGGGGAGGGNTSGDDDEFEDYSHLLT